MVTPRLPRNFPSNRQLFITYVFIILFIFCEVYYCRYVLSLPYFITFSKLPSLTKDQSHINFHLWFQPKSDVMFSIVGYGAKTKNQLVDFCDEAQKRKVCSIPLFIGGKNVNFSIFDSKRILYTQIFDLPDLNFSCTTPNWENRRCRATNACFNLGTFAVTSPFQLEFDQNLLTLGARSPPTDFVFSRMINKLRCQYSLPKGVPFIKNNSNLMSIFHHMEQEWHLYFDLLLPAFLTITKNGIKESRNHQLLFPQSFCDLVPHIIAAFTDNRIICLSRPFCFKEIEFGMEKMTNFKLNDIDPPYDFPNVSLKPFRSSIYKFLEIPENKTKNKETISSKQNNRKMKILFVNRYLTRTIINQYDILDIIKRVFPDADVELRGFEKLSWKDQILATEDIDMLIAMHGSALANLMWMKEGAAVVEIFPYKFTCRDWYERACRLAKLKYFGYHLKSKEETSKNDDKNNNDLLKKCHDGAFECSSAECLDLLRDQNSIINQDNFQMFLKNVSELIKK